MKINKKNILKKCSLLLIVFSIAISFSACKNNKNDTKTHAIDNEYLKLKKYKGIVLRKKSNIKVNEDLVNREIEKFLLKKSKKINLKDKSRKIQQKDLVVCNINILIDKKVVAKNVEQVLLVSNKNDVRFRIPGYTTNLIGHKIGDVFKKSLGAKSKIPNNKDIELEYSVKKVIKVKKAKLTNSFVKKHVKGCNTVKEFKEKIRKKLKKQISKQVKMEMQQDIINYLLRNVVLKKYDRKELKKGLKQVRNNQKRMLIQQNIKEEEFLKSKNITKKQYEDSIKKQVIDFIKLRMVAKEIVRREGLNISKEKDKIIKDVMKMRGYKKRDAFERALNLRSNRDQKTMIEEMAMIQTVTNFIYKCAIKV